MPPILVRYSGRKVTSRTFGDPQGLRQSIRGKNGRREMKQASILVAAAVVAVLLGTGANAQNFRLCAGEYWEPWKGGQCPTSEPYAYCGQAESEATRICREHGATGKPLMVKIRDVPGKKCGFATFNVTCQ
jgi:hypothetical protein